MFRSLFAFRGFPTQELASVICNNEQGDLFYSAGLHRNLCWPQLTQENLRRGFLGKNEGGWARKAEIRKKKSLAVGEACMAIF